MKTALITGITGQDGAYLAELLLSKGYMVHGVKRRSSLINTYRIDHLYVDPHENNANFKLHYGDMTDSTNLIRIVQETQPDEIYNLAAMSHVKVSFDTPEYTANADGIGTLRLMEAIRILKLEKKTRFYQASTSELYGLVKEVPQKETTPFYPRSPYGVAKLYAYWMTVNYRAAYGMYRILQADEPDDFVLATGETRSVREFVELAFAEVGRTIEWRGKGVEETGIDRKSGKTVVRIDPTYFRPTEVDLLIGDASKARKKLGWQPKTSFAQLVKEMVAGDLAIARREVANGKDPV